MKKTVMTLILVACFFSITAAPVGAVSEPVDLGSVLDEHGAIMLLIDPDTSDILYANQAAAAFYGYSIDELQHMKITQINTLSAEETAQEMQKAAAGSRNYFVFRHRLASGDIRNVEVYSYPVQYGGSEVLFSVIHDITDKTLLQEKERKLVIGGFLAGTAVIIALIILLLLLFAGRRRLNSAKNEIENFSRLMETFFNADSNQTYLKDENLKYVFVNSAFQEAYKMRSGEVIGKDDFELFEAGFAEERRKTDLAVLDKRELINDEVLWNGKVYSTTKFPVRMPGGEIGIGAYIREVTEELEQKKSQEKILERNKILVDVLSLSFDNKQEQLNYVLHRALNLTDSKYGYIYYYDEEAREFELNSWTEGVMAECAVNDPQVKYKLEKTGIWGEVVRQRKPIIVNNFQKPNPLKKGYPEGHVELYRFMSVPIFIDEKIVAGVGLGNKEAEYDENDLVNISILMGGAWQAVQRREAREQLNYERNKYLQTLISIGDGVMVVDKDGKIEILNDVGQKLTGWTNSEARGRYYKEVFVLSHEQPDKVIDDPIEYVFRTNSVQELGNDAVLTSRNGTRYFLEDSAAPVHNESGKNVGVVLVFRDVSEKKEYTRKIEYLSFHDKLTGLYNRSFFEEEIRRLDVERNLPITIVMGDVNALKLTNDVFGHACGDDLLKSISEVLRLSCRADDIIARWGGDEFVLLLPKTGIKEAEGIVSRIKGEFSKKRFKAIKGSISMGYFCKSDADESIMEVLGKAEENMYLQKTLERDAIKEDEVNTIIQMLHENSEREKVHSQNVSMLCEMMGKALGLSETEVRNLKSAGYLHDIGKIVLEKDLLNIARSFNTEEKSEVKKHPVVGYRILNTADSTLDITESVLFHHEHWDGSGYPKGLKGEEIPLQARIIAVAQCYDRIIQEAGEDQGSGKKQALEALRGGAGTKYDPRIVAVFLRMLDLEGQGGGS
jgi:diguanylate cyclase (GGDEF)-like protein/PAS domain S-box-containing protein